ncbi:NAD-dependent epimerase/dehydratase family protein [Microbacterium jejuense]|uniref:NAD-dependent epimerase/dehydratase family protein n=1 Tax=Microbacterium jejuense TaxID=1263637 RepID=A0ABS7HQG4_9MICO|nr:NAD-dependent epimerase/dehydratase family protein [Microbacterium jejuense]MBW9095209.1 NAD-dependent epimerase/dehydratase family protein [Microbacterium jejuense]
MKIFIAGATGAVGSRLVSPLVAAGHEVTGTSRSEAGARRVDAAGGHGVVMDGRDAASIRRAVLDAQPDVVVHQLTSLSAGFDFKRFDEVFAVTNELRTRGTDALIAAAHEAGTERIVVQSYTGWPNERTGGPVKTEADPLDAHPVPAAANTLAAIAHAERATVAAGGLALRFGSFYGPGQSLGEGGEMLEAVRKRQVPIVGGGAGVWSFCHIDDAASATIAAITRGDAGVYNIVDDEPATVSVWLPELARAIGAKAPLRVPAWIARSLIGDFGVAWMTTARGSSNAKAKAQLGWTPRYASWREGFRTGLGTR